MNDYKNITLDQFIEDLIQIRNEEKLGDRPVMFSVISRTIVDENAELVSTLNVHYAHGIAKIYSPVENLIDRPSNLHCVTIMLDKKYYRHNVVFDRK